MPERVQLSRAKAPRITELSEPPVIGRFYMVPTVRWEWADWERDWPVFLPRHDDVDFFKVAQAHFHVDPRFVPERIWRHLDRNLWKSALERVQSVPIWRHAHGPWSDREPPEPVWRRRKCRRVHLRYAYGYQAPPQAIRAHYAGQTCPRNRFGWVCPHKRVSLGSIAPDGGIIVCPLHGLRIRAADGLVLPADPDAPPSPPTNQEDAGG